MIHRKTVSGAFLARTAPATRPVPPMLVRSCADFARNAHPSFPTMLIEFPDVTPDARRFDVIVIGTGCAGMAAALFAAIERASGVANATPAGMCAGDAYRARVARLDATMSVAGVITRPRPSRWSKPNGVPHPAGAAARSWRC